MATATVGDIITRADVILQDNNVRWPLSELLYWLNDAYRAIVMQRPDSNMKSGTFTCAVGTRQVLTKSGGGGFPEALRLRSVVRNLAGSRRAVRLIQQAVLDDQRPGWHAETGSVDVQHYVYDPLNPTEFLVYPPATSAAQLEVVYSSVPTQHSIAEGSIKTSTEVIKLPDIYVNPILDYILYRAYAKDSEYAANAQRAGGHFQAYSAALGAGVQADAATAPQDDSRSSGNHGAN
jgi:predicted Rdx family selenoprotein